MGKTPLANVRLLVILLSIAGVFLMVRHVLTSRHDDLAYAADFPSVGQPAPDFTLPDLDNNAVTLSAYKGKVVLLNFWATWCAPCVTELPAMEKLYRELKGEGLVLLAVSVDDSSAQLKIQQFRERFLLSFRILRDTSAAISEKKFGTFRLPETYLIDRTGVIQNKIIGAQSWDNPRTVELLRRFIKTGKLD